MSVHTNFPGNTHIVVDGLFVNARVSRVVEAINDYYKGEVRVTYLPEGARSEGQAAFGIEHHPPGGRPYVISYVKDEADFDERVLQRLIFNDQRSSKVQLSELEAWDRAQAAVKRQEFLDAMEEAGDIAYHVLKSPKNQYKVSNDLIIHDNIPFNAARLHRKKHL